MLKFTLKYLIPEFIITPRRYKTDCVRVRFAPSPTGFLHLGGLRTAVYNFLFARKFDGKFILRIEDTDQTRLVPGALQQIQEDLKWAGIEIHEGPTAGGSFGPYIQSERIDIYRKNVQYLLENGSAYHCFCTEKRLDLLRKAAIRAHEVPKYDNRCRILTREDVYQKLEKGETSCIRFKISDKEESFEDLIYGNISYNISLNEGDPVIVKSDGYPTYHFANVVDDHLMKISHVLRGVEWQISTTKHILLYRAFNWKPPQYGHLPLLMNADGTKLSKRQGDIKIGYYRENHIFPLALLNFITHSGGGFSKDSERHLKPKCYTIEELTDQFDISRINSHSGKLMFERLSEFNNLELQRKLNIPKERQELVHQVRELLQVSYPDRIRDNSLKLDEEHILNILLWAQDRISKLSDLVSKNMEFLWTLPKSTVIDGTDLDNVKLIRNELETATDLTTDKLNVLFKGFCKKHNVDYRHFMKIMRLILSGLKEGPGVTEIIVILGKKNTLERLELYLNKIANER